MQNDRELESLSIRPCTRTWESLQSATDGDERRRYCDDCALHVHDLSAYTRRQADKLLAQPGRTCVLKQVSADGSALTRPDWRERVGARLRAWASGLTLFLTSMGASLLGACSETTSVAETEPVESRRGSASEDAPSCSADSMNADSLTDEQLDALALRVLGYVE